MLRVDARRSKEFDNVTVQNVDDWPLEQVCEEIRRTMAPGARRVHAQLYKLLIYQEGDFFHCHQDAQQAANMFGSLLFFLPVQYEGGVFQLSKLQTTWSQEAMISVEDRKDPKGCSWAAFFTDVIHKVTDVKGGFRVVLNYVLTFEDSMCPSPSLPFFSTDDIQFVHKYFQGTRNEIVLPLFYAYTKASLSPSFLKGRDAHLFNAMHACGLDLALRFVLRTEKTVVSTPHWTPSYDDDYDEPPESDWSMEFFGDVVLVEPALVEKSYALDAELQEMEKEAHQKQDGSSGRGSAYGRGSDPWHEYWNAKEDKRRALAGEIIEAQKERLMPKWIQLKHDDGGDVHGRPLWNVGSKYKTQWLGNMTPPIEFFYMEAAMVIKKVG